MHEIEFLPAWYPQALRRQSILRLHISTGLLVLIAMGTWSWQSHRNIAVAQRSVDTVNAQLAQSKLELHQLDEQLELQRQLELQHRIVVRLGLPVEMSRVMQTVESLMPKEMSLVELHTDRVEVDVTKSMKTVGTGAANDKTAEPIVDRTLKVSLTAVAPSDFETANFIAGLTSTMLFENIAMTYSRDKSQAGHLLREFQVTFTMKLNENGSPARDANDAARDIANAGGED